MLLRAAHEWRDPAPADRCTVDVAAVAGDLFSWHRRGVSIRMVEPLPDGGVRLGIPGGAAAVAAVQALLTAHYRFPVDCYPWD
jgi:hypothetical protein